MLYLTTRNKFDAYTKAHPLKGSRADNGGYYIPFKMPALPREELHSLREKSVSQTVAEILNLFFKTELCSWDVEFSIGRYPLRLSTVNHRIAVAELWHNPEGKYESVEKALALRLDPQIDTKNIPSWVRIAIRIAVLFAVYGEMLRNGCVNENHSFDASVATGDFTAAMALWYARQMGLPIGNIVCGCNENSAVWELLHLGEFATGISVRATTTPDGDIAVPEELERLICATLGVDETLHYCDVLSRGGLYGPPAGTLETLRGGMYGAVVSKSRVEGMIPSVYRTGGYILGPYTALAFGGLQDYRAKTGQTAPALLLADRSPVRNGKLVAAAMNITETELTKLLSEI